MIDGYNNKELKTGKHGTTRLKCLADCWAPGLGEFKAGDVLSGTALVEKLKGNTNFIELKEEA